MANEVKNEQVLSQILENIRNINQLTPFITSQDDNRRVYAALLQPATRISKLYGFSLTNNPKTRRRR